MPFTEKGEVFKTRIRSRNGPTPCIATWPSNEVTRQLFNWGVTLMGRDVLVSEKCPNWRRKIARGLDATTTYIVDAREVQFVPGFYHLGLTCTNGYTASDQVWGQLNFGSDIATFPAAPSTAYSQKANDQALQRFVSRAREAMGSFRGANFLAEFADVVRGIRNPAKGIRSLLDTYHQRASRAARRAARGRTLPRSRQQFYDFERSNRGAARAVERAVSDQWLEFQFGALPLGNDIADAITAGQRLQSRTPRIRVSGRGQEVTSIGTLIDNATLNFGDLVCETISQAEVSVNYFGAVKLEVDSPFIGRAQEFGLGAKDFVPAVWEAIPFSFLVDYFTNVGEIVEAWSFPRTAIAYAGRTTKWENSRELSRFRLTLNDDTATLKYECFNFMPSFTKTRRMHIERYRYSGPWVPSLRFEIPGSRHWRKWLNIGALSAMRFL